MASFADPKPRKRSASYSCDRCGRRLYYRAGRPQLGPLNTHRSSLLLARRRVREMKTTITLQITWDDDEHVADPALWDWAELLDLPNRDNVRVLEHETGDDSIWREVCDSHDTFLAEHEPTPLGPDPIIAPKAASDWKHFGPDA